MQMKESNPMETASNEAKRMNCIGFEVKHTRAMDPSVGICAASLGAQLNWRKTHATIHRRWSRLAPKLVGGRIGLRRVDQPSGPGPVEGRLKKVPPRSARVRKKFEEKLASVESN